MQPTCMEMEMDNYFVGSSSLSLSSSSSKRYCSKIRCRPVSTVPCDMHVENSGTDLVHVGEEDRIGCE